MGVGPDSAPAATQEELLVWSNATQRTEEVWPSSVETETFMGQELRATFVVVFMCCLPGNSLRWTRERRGEGAVVLVWFDCC